MKDTLEALRAENERLNEQVKLLVQTEQRLHRSQSALDKQLARLAALAALTTQDNHGHDPFAVLEGARDLLEEQFLVDEAVALRVDPGSATATVPVIVRHGPPLAGPLSPACIESLLAQQGVALMDLARGPHCLRTLVDTVFERGPSTEEGTVTILAICRHNRPLGWIATLTNAASTSYHRDRPDPSHTEFLRLVASYAARTLDGALLHHQMLEQGRELAETNARLTTSLNALQSAQQELAQSQKMEAIGQLAGGVAHDFNNLLTVITSHAELIREAAAEDAPISEDATTIKEAARRASEITRRLLAFGRKDERTVEAVDLNDLVIGFSRTLGRLIGEHITLRLQLAPSIARAQVDRTQIEQVLMNLIVNARDAMPTGGTLTVTTRWAEAHELPADVRPGTRYLAICVADTGHGMDEATKARIFEPFFTTKQVGRGTGLGLAVVYGLVRQNLGAIHVESILQRGTSFTVVVPTPDASSQAEALAPHEALATVLLVEDEDLIRRVAARVLRLEGYRVLEASNAHEARVQFDQGPFDLLLTDVVMPGESGVLLATAFRSAFPSAHILYMSGYTFDQLDVQELDHATTSFMAKPFAPETLRARVREALSHVLEDGRLRRRARPIQEQVM